MREELHELLGGAGVATLIAVVLLGAALYFYPRVRSWLPLARPRLALLHRWGAIGFVPLVAAHYVLAPRVHPLQAMGALGLVAAFALGWSLRRDKRHYLPIVQAKAVLTLVGAVALFAGHALLEDDERGRGEHHAAISAVTAPASDAGASPRSGLLPPGRAA